MCRSNKELFSAEVQDSSLSHIVWVHVCIGLLGPKKMHVWG